MSKNYYDELIKRKNELERSINRAETFLHNAPEGRIKTSINGSGYQQYYYVTDNSGPKGKYINREDSSLIRRLIQKEYSKKFIRDAKKELSILDSLEKCYDCCNPEDEIVKLHKSKRQFIDPYIISDDEYRRRWESTEFNTNDFNSDEKVYQTKKGDLVRSKSEMLLADMYYELNIPYRYECKLILDNGKKKYPDFTILDVRNRREIYHEHLGLLDNEAYRKGNVIKIAEYYKNGIFTGNNLIITFETRECPLNIAGIRKNIIDMLLIEKC